jgi:hypothetical protein
VKRPSPTERAIGRDGLAIANHPANRASAVSKPFSIAVAHRGDHFRKTSESHDRNPA